MPTSTSLKGFMHQLISTTPPDIIHTDGCDLASRFTGHRDQLHALEILVGRVWSCYMPLDVLAANHAVERAGLTDWTD